MCWTLWPFPYWLKPSAPQPGRMRSYQWPWWPAADPRSFRPSQPPGSWQSRPSTCINLHQPGYGSIPIHTIFSGMNIHKSQLFWCELQGYKVLTHPHLDDEKTVFPVWQSDLAHAVHAHCHVFGRGQAQPWLRPRVAGVAGSKGGKNR